MMKLNFKIILILFAALLAVSGSELESQKKHIILFIGDGMHLEHEIAASRYIKGIDNGLVFHKFPYKAYCTTWNIDTYNHYANLNSAAKYNPDNFKPVFGYDHSLGGAMPYPLSFPDTQFDYFITKGEATDSAAAGTAISTGRKTDRGNIAWMEGDPDNGALPAISEQLKNKLGYSIGIVSTVQFCNATPAVFVSHNKHRHNYIEISHEIITKMKPDVVIGGGHPQWSGGFRYLSSKDYDTLKKSDEYIFAEREKGINGSAAIRKAAKKAIADKKKLFALFGGSRGYFENPVPHHNPGNPEFDIEPENPTLADAVESTIDILKRDPDGFFVMFEQGDIDWANHANDYNWMIGSVHDLNEAVKAAVKMVDCQGDDMDWSNTTLIVTSDHSNSYMRLNKKNIPGKGELPPEKNFSDYITYSSSNHTNEPVMIYVKGNGSEIFKKFEGKWYPGTNLIDNTDIYKAIKKITGL